MLGAVASSACFASCAEPVPPVEWLGPGIHVRMEGRNEGRPVGAQNEDPDMLSLAGFHCERTYEVPEILGAPDPSLAELVSVNVSLLFRSNERLQRITIDFREHDFQADAPGTDVRIVPRQEGVSAGPDEVVFELSIFDALLDEVFVHGAAKFGVVTLQEFGGTPPQGSRVIPEGDGNVGLTFDVVFHPETYFRGSITAPCTVNHIVPVAP